MLTNLEDITKLSSPSALSLLASGGTTAIPALAIGGAMLVVSAAVFSYKEYTKYNEKKHKAKIEEINAIWDDKLKRVIVPFYGEISGFPPIFQLNNDNKYESLNFTIDQIKDVGKNLPGGGDVALVSFRESIRSALRKLKEYYFLTLKHNEKDEITLRVLTYLMNIISTKCLNFLGYEYDIAYLGAINEFINVYASLGNGEYSQHFDRLKEVYTNLLEAKQKLEKHKEVISLDETISALREHCMQHSDLLIRTLIKMVARKEDVDLVTTVNHSELIDGLLRQHYIRSEIWGFTLRSDRQIELPQTIFKQWIKDLSKYYLSSLDIENTHENEENPIYKNFFSFIEQAERYLKTQALDEVDKQTKISNQEMKEQLSLIISAFKKSENFLSTIYRVSDRKFHTVTDEDQIIDRTKVIANFAKLIDDVISLQHLCIHISKSIKELGELYVKNPLHFNKIFNAVDKLCELIQQDLKTVMEGFTLLQQKNKDQMQVAKKELFPNEVKKLLDALAVGIERLGAKIKNCRKKAKKAIKSDAIESAAYEMLEVAESILGRYFANPNLDVPANADEQGLVSKKRSQVQSSVARKNPSLNEVFVVPQLKNQIKKIYSQILDLSEGEGAFKQEFLKVYDALVKLQIKAISLQTGKNIPEENIYKAKKTAAVALFVARKTQVLLNKSANARAEEVILASKEVHNVLNTEDNSDAIDYHRNPVSRFISTNLCNFGLFKTDTRKRCMELENAYANLSEMAKNS